MAGLARGARNILWVWAALVASPARATTDADIWALIDSLRPVAAAITVDGNPSDWGAIPAFSDPTGDAGGDLSRDITSVRIAPTADALYVLIQTAGAPSTDGFAFWIQFDFMGEQYSDVDLAFGTQGQVNLRYFEETGCSNPSTGCSITSWNGAQIAIGSAVEIKVPYAALDAALPPSMQGKLMGSGARSWVRVWPRTVAYPPGVGYTVVDDGATVGSFRLVPTPYPLDPPLPSGGDVFTSVPVPLNGLWYIGQGAMTHGTHQGIWAYDMYIADNELKPESPKGSMNLTDNYSFGQPIFAPVAGTVYSLDNSNPDHTPYDPSSPGPPNFLFEQIPANLGLLYSHIKQGTVAFAQGNAVPAGAVVGRVGNSGSPSWPHLHFEARNISNNQSQPLGYTSTQVGLNPGLNPSAADPWRRNVTSWGIREGFTVVPEPGVAGSTALCYALLVLARRRALRCRSSAQSSPAPDAIPSAPEGSGRSVPS
jgi:hypothetical protein